MKFPMMCMMMMILLITFLQPIESRSRRRKHSSGMKKSIEANRIVGELTNLVNEIEVRIFQFQAFILTQIFNKSDIFIKCISIVALYI